MTLLSLMYSHLIMSDWLGGGIEWSYTRQARIQSFPCFHCNSIGAHPQHRNPRVSPQHHVEPSLLRLDGAHSWIPGCGSMCKTLTYDRGKKRAGHEQLARRLAIHIFFADPYKPWQGGINKNTNRLLR